MNIESKTWKVRSGDIAGQADITNKRTGETRAGALSDVPSANRLALLQEAAFDCEISEVFYSWHS